MLSDIKILFAFRLAISALLIFGSVSCIAEKEVDTPDKVVESALRISTRKAVTRGDEHFADDPHAEGEEALRRISLFFFSDKNSADAAFFTYEIDDAGAQTTADLTVRIPNYMLKGRTKVYVYALVNLPDDIAVNAVANTIGSKPATLENLKAVWVSDEGFATRGVVAGTFVMRGDAEVTVGGSGSDMTVEGDIFVERLAAKIRLWADIENILYINTTTGKTINRSDYVTEAEWQAAISGENVETWKSETYDGEESNVKLYLYNLTTRGRIGGSASGNGYFGDDYPGEDYANRDEMWAYRDVDRSDDSAEAVRVLATGVDIEDEDVESDKYIYTHSLAYYSYPNIWQSTEPTEERQTYLIVSVPWKKVVADGESGEYRVCYYQIPVNALRGTTATSGEVFRIDPNRYYRISVHIAMLGSRDMGKPTEIEAGYEVADWVQNDVNVNIKDRRYLVVNQKEWTMNNASTIEIPFSTSHTTVIDKCYVTYFRYRDSWGTDKDANSSTDSNGQRLTPDEIHNRTEFNDWVNAAGTAGVKESEGEISITLNNIKTMLYYKHEYFYDEIYQGLEGNGYRYYVGHEQPKTFQHGKISRQQNRSNGMTTNGTDDQAWGQYVEKYGLDSIYTYSIDSKNGIISFTHPLIQWKEVTSGNQRYYTPDLNPRTGHLWDEFSRIEISILIRHEDWTNDDGLYRETIHITQYPGMYIEVSHNYGTAGSNGNQYVLVNGPSSNNNEYFEVVNKLTNFLGSNNNPNMYVIHTTQLSEDNGGMYEIGDPRTLNRNNYLLTDVASADINNPEKYMEPLVDGDHSTWVPNTTNNIWTGFSHGKWDKRSSTTINVRNASYSVTVANAKHVHNINGNNQRLTWYYPTDETEGYGSKENFIAPVLRVASSFGKAIVDGRPQMRRRCASYQEAGRPAGRWRLPTRAEVFFIAQLSADHRIPILFGAPTATKPGYYWTAQCGINADGDGHVYDNPNNEGDPGSDNIRIYPFGTFAARCVYDEWYWTKIDGTDLPTPNGNLETTFYWGDQEKDNTQK